MSSPSVDRYKRLSARIDALNTVLSARMKLAICAACAQRGFLALYQHEPLPLDVAERALELLWAGALGEHVSVDQFGPVTFALGDAIDELSGDMLACEAAICQTLGLALDCFNQEEPLALHRTLGSLLEASEDREEIELQEYAWIDDVLTEATNTADNDISRHLFSTEPPAWLLCYMSDVESLDEVESLNELRLQLIDDSQRRFDERIARVNVWRAGPHKPWREPSGMPAHLVSKKVNRAPSSTQGNISTLGHDFVGVFDRELNQLLFAPKQAVALGMSLDEKTLFAWRVEKRPECSGVARADYNWFIDKYTWPEAALLSSHEFADKQTIAWCWPVRLDVPVSSEEAVILRVRSEDEVKSVRVVLEPNPTQPTQRTQANEIRAFWSSAGQGPGSASPVVVTLEAAQLVFSDEISGIKGNFLGLIDQRNDTIQFRYHGTISDDVDDARYLVLVDFPVKARQGSYTKEVTIGEVPAMIALVFAKGASHQLFGDLHFESWARRDESSTTKLPALARLKAATSTFSPKLRRQFLQIFKRIDETHLAHLDAIDLVKTSKEYAAVITFVETLGTDDLGFSVSQRANLENIAGNAHANLKQPELSLARHELATNMLRGESEVFSPEATGEYLEQFAYALCQRVRRLVGLKRLAQAGQIVDELASLKQVTSDFWTRNRFWEASVLLANALRDDDRFEAVLACVKGALAIPMFSPNEYSRKAQPELFNLAALSLRKLKRLDEAHSYCLQTLALARGGLKPTDRDEIAWGILEGAFVSRQRAQPADSLKYIEGLAWLESLHEGDAQYAEVLRADAMISLGQLTQAAEILARVTQATEPWIEASLICTQARLAFELGKHEQAVELATLVIKKFTSDKNSEDEVERANLILQKDAARN